MNPYESPQPCGQPKQTIDTVFDVVIVLHGFSLVAMVTSLALVCCLNHMMSSSTFVYILYASTWTHLAFYVLIIVLGTISGRKTIP